VPSPSRTVRPERGVQPLQRLGPVRAVRDDLRQQGVVVRTDHRSLGDPGVDPDPGQAPRLAQGQDAPAGGQEPGDGVLGVDAHLDGVPAQHDVVLHER
jgi:hypothetical protein